jgi:two-component system, NarL family, sensor kinase
MKMIIGSAILYFSCLISAAYGQSQSRQVDSLKNVILSLPNDTSKVNQLNTLATKIQFDNPLGAIELLEKAVEASQEVKYDLGLSMAYGLRANLLFYELKLDSSKYLVDKAYALVASNNDVKHRKQKAQLINRYASIFQQRQKYDSAVNRYLQAAALFTELKDESKLIYTNYNLSGIYNSLGDTAKAIFYARETRRIANKVNDPAFILRSHIVLGDAFVSLLQYDSVQAVSRIGLSMAKQQNMTFAMGKFRSLLGIFHTNQTKNYDSAIFYFNSALDYFFSINTRYDIAIVLQNMGHTYLLTGDYEKAVKHLKQGVDFSKELNLDNILRLCLLDLVTAEEKLGHAGESLRYLKEYVTINDSVQSRANRKIVYELETRYQTQKKETLLLAQQKSLRQKNILAYILTGALVSASLISFLLYRTYRQRQKLQQQRIRELETEKLLTATEAVLKGEEQERSRLAKDLHDGLGGMLSGVKFSLTSMKGNQIMTPDNVQAFGRSLDMLDSSIKELRRIAHNMMPESLIRFGLPTAVHDFCKDVGNNTLRVVYQAYGVDNLSLENTVAVSIYRVIQELVNNTLKHAQASELLIQLSLHDHVLEVTVEDNGKGWNTEEALKEKGMGWSNIESRINYLKGAIDVKSAPGKGTSVIITIPV